MLFPRCAARPLLLMCLAWGVATGCGDTGGKNALAKVEDAGTLIDTGSGSDDAASDGAVAPPDAAAPVPADAAVAPDAAAPDLGAAPQDAGPPPLGPDALVVPVPPEVASVETTIGVPSTLAGVAERVTCAALDRDGAAMPDVETTFEVRPQVGWQGGDSPTEIVGILAGTYSVTCAAPNAGLRDATPARWDVFPGAPASVVARVDRARVNAGDLVSVTCEATDAQGNVLPADDAVVDATPGAAGNVVEGRRITFTQVGRYQVACTLPGVVSAASAEVVVEPALPATLLAALSPEAPVYQPGMVVTFRPIIEDVYGNRIEDVGLVYSSAPLLPGFGEGRFHLDREGRFHVGVCTVGPTATGADLCAEADLLVDAGGPAIRCTSPQPGSMLVRGGPIQLEGDVGDSAGVQRLTVDGRVVPVDAAGHFSTQVNPAWGLNIHDVVATDAVGNESSIFCAYFTSERYHPENTALPDALQLGLTQGAIDDGPPSRPILSLTDLLRSVINSQGLIDTIDASLRAQNPVVPNECRERVLGVCLLSAGAEYRGLRIRGPNTMASTLLDGGLRVRGRINGLELDVKLLGTLGNTGTLFADYIGVDLTFDIGLVNGRPQIGLRQVDAIDVGPMSSNFDGFITGTLLDLIFGAFEGTVRNTVAGALRDYLQNQVDALLTGVLSGVDVASFNAALALPALGGGPPVNAQIGFGLDALVATPQLLRLGIATLVTGPAREAADSLGVPLPPGDVGVVLHPNGTAGASVAIGFVNQVLHTLWRGGMFRIDDGGGLAGNLPDGAALTLRVALPPAAIGTGADNGIRLFLGPVTGSLLYPGIFDEPLQIQLAATATAAVSLVNGNEIRFGGDAGIQVERLALMVDGVVLTPQTRATLEQLFTRVVQSLLDQSLSGALPTLPVPDFALPDSLSMYGVPAGTRLGLRQLRLSGTPSHWLVDGVFGE